MEPASPQRDNRNEEYWRKYLEGEPDSLMRVGRRVFGHLPADPRCRLCTAPFRGAGGQLMRMIGKRQSAANPYMCTSCERELIKHHGGAEVTGTMLFADIRGSTALAERMTPGEFHELLNRFYTAASQAVISHDGAINKFVGDELVAFFFRTLAGERHVARAIEAAEALLRATGHADPGGPWVPVGAGVHTGRAWFGAAGEGGYVELTAVGDAVNVAARLAAAAGTGEILVSTDAAAAAGLDPGLERRTLELKGKQESTEVVSLRVA
jgi:adenylate cyclase